MTALSPIPSLTVERMFVHICEHRNLWHAQETLCLQAKEREALEKLRKELEAERALARSYQRELEAAVEKVGPHCVSLMANHLALLRNSCVGTVTGQA